MSTSNEPLNYEYAYIEIRNLLAYTFNVIASEVGDGLTPIDIGVKKDDSWLRILFVLKPILYINPLTQSP
jgi:hypothetical protein